MRIWALSDLHLSHPGNRGALESLPAFPEDWLLLAGDVTHGERRLDKCFELLTGKFRQVVWVPGNHELWTVPRTTPPLSGVALYERLVRVARSHGVLTPEDPYPVVEHPAGPVLIAPLFLLYDYSFRPPHIGREDVVRWAREGGTVCGDELLLHPDPFPDRDSWCAARCEDAEARLASHPADLPKILVNHYPLEEQHAVLPRIPRFTPWCGTRRTRGWHRRFNACAVVYGHLHIRGTEWLDGVPFHEVSLGYPKQWDRPRGVAAYLREVRPEMRTAAERKVPIRSASVRDAGAAPRPSATRAAGRVAG
ncbi:MAG: metallophosphoesterase [Gemmatimonadetes bacterium]|nr:metallophosphoesterase [Gemmatimonadota bacterium]MYD13461.1 metallophosphoesterase [Gemmatimonadota bacterium]MYI66076.1 metallophosphoesterase [Gemmatimonadota bacterium]